MKTLAIRLEDDTHAQLSVLAQLEELTVTDAIRQAIDNFIDAKRSQPELTARAEAVLADIDRDAASKREAIASLFEGDGPTAKPAGGTGAKSPSRSSRNKGDAPAN
jgi:predicted transcriptional regulator